MNRAKKPWELSNGRIKPGTYTVELGRGIVGFKPGATRSAPSTSRPAGKASGQPGQSHRHQGIDQEIASAFLPLDVSAYVGRSPQPSRSGNNRSAIDASANRSARGASRARRRSHKRVDE